MEKMTFVAFSSLSFKICLKVHEVHVYVLGKRPQWVASSVVDLGIFFPSRGHPQPRG